MKLKAAMMFGLAFMFVQPASAQTIGPLGQAVIRTKICNKVSDWVREGGTGEFRGYRCIASCLPGEVAILSWIYELDRTTDQLDARVENPVFFGGNFSGDPSFPPNRWGNYVAIGRAERTLVVAKIQLACVAASAFN